MSLSVDADIPTDTDLLGKSVTDLQEDVAVSNGVISGTLKYVTGYTGFSGDPDLQEGNYLVIHSENSDATALAIRKIGGEETKTLDADGLAIVRVSEGDLGIEIISTEDGETRVNRFVFNLTLESEE